LALTAAGLAGCKAQAVSQGSERHVTASYRFRTLTADLPPDIRVPAATAAAQAALRSRSYAVKESTVTADAGRIEATPVDAGLLDKIIVSVKETGSNARIHVRVEPMGDQAKSRAILDSILTQLGQ
jgi:hypothetical protein